MAPKPSDPRHMIARRDALIRMATALAGAAVPTMWTACGGKDNPVKPYSSSYSSGGYSSYGSGYNSYGSGYTSYGSYGSYGSYASYNSYASYSSYSSASCYYSNYGSGYYSQYCSYRGSLYYYSGYCSSRYSSYGSGYLSCRP